MLLLSPPKKRRSIRRAIRVPCIAVTTDNYRLIGQRVLDLSPRGMLISSASDVALGEEVFVSFLPPGDGRWMNAQAEVTRLVPGLRPWDPGPSVGLVFTNLSVVKRGELLARLAGIPPTVPRRPLRFRAGYHKAATEPAYPTASVAGLPDGIWSDFYTRFELPTAPPSTAARGVFSN